MSDSKPSGISRRGLLTSAAFVPVAALTAAEPAGAQQPGLELPIEARDTLSALIDRLAPTDATGPGALDCGALDYITRAFGNYLAPEMPALTKALSEINAYAVKTQGVDFRSLTPDARDTIIAAMEKDDARNAATGITPDGRTVFLRLRQLTLEGMFSDPYYGGNRRFAGWDLLRYPGARLGSAPADQQLKEMPKPQRQSAWGSEYGR